ncbi:MAG: hypothetical protein Q8M11_06340 [Sulfuritalea sp.]|nr:hypothetical protein [Sulfuritalea sp.]MDP1983079.1 hypothetical protein [Sulfuritalea sp.]
MLQLRRLLGRILIEGGFVAHADVAHALDAQRTTNTQLGEVLVGMGVLDSRQLQVVLSIQNDLSDPEKALTLAAGIRRRLGELLVDAGVADRRQLEDALAEQARTGEKLGEIVLRRGWLDRRQLDRLLRFQEAQSGKQPSPVPLRLGEILVATGDITRGQLDEALARQHLSERPLGSLLVDAGYLKPSQLAYGLHLQRMLLMAALAACAVATNQPAEAAGNKAQVAVSATVLRHVSARSMTAPHSVSISAADIGRGYVDVPVPSTLEIRSNSPSGYLLAFGSQAEFASGIEVHGVGGGASFGRFGGVLNVRTEGRGMQTIPVELNFRILLSENARPGTYPWPIQITVLPG